MFRDPQALVQSSVIKIHSLPEEIVNDKFDTPPPSARERVNCFGFPLILMANANQIWNDKNKI